MDARDRTTRRRTPRSARGPDPYREGRGIWIPWLLSIVIAIAPHPHHRTLQAHATSQAAVVRSLRHGIAWARTRTWHWQIVAGVHRSPTIRHTARYHSPGYLRWVESRWNRRRLRAYKLAHRPAYQPSGGSLRAFAGCLVPLVDREDPAWSPTATNPSSGAYGLPQALPGSKMASAGADWATNPYTQLRWMRAYVNARYGGCSGALAHSYAYGWY